MLHHHQHFATVHQPHGVRPARQDLQDVPEETPLVQLDVGDGVIETLIDYLLRQMWWYSGPTRCQGPGLCALPTRPMLGVSNSIVMIEKCSMVLSFCHEIS